MEPSAGGAAPALSPLRAFLVLLKSPGRGLEEIRQRPMRLRSLALFLLGVGFLRGFLDVPWVYWQAGRLPLLPPLLTDPGWYLYNIGPFILSDVVTALVRWVLFTTIVYGLGRFLAGQGSYRVTLNFFGAVLGITLVTILVDYLYLFFQLPLIRFQVSPQYSPVIGLGQVITSVWIGFVTWLLARREYGLPFWPALSLGAFIPLLNTGLFLLVMRALFWLLPEDARFNSLVPLLNTAFVVLGLAAFAWLFLLGRRGPDSKNKVRTKKVTDL